ncbi:hypothetical protein Taro_025980, partial [Colocasia esculenta]|nr:hypothetical protein [Colocasia esculenta]
RFHFGLFLSISLLLVGEFGDPEAIAASLGRSENSSAGSCLPSHLFFLYDPESDGDSDAPVYEAHYRPISPDADSDTDDSAGYVAPVHSNGGDLPRHNPTNSISLYDRTENGVSRLDLNGNGMHAGEQRQGDEDEENEEREREVEASISRAFSEDESRRSAPLTRENAARVMEAMRGVSFPGCPPEWVDQVPEDRWIDQLRRLRSGESARTPQS